MPGKKYEEWEDEIIIANAARLTCKEIAALLPERSQSGVIRRRRWLRDAGRLYQEGWRYGHWTDEEIANLRGYAKHYTLREIARLMGRSANAVRQKRNDLSLHCLSAGETKGANLLTKEIAKILGVSTITVQHWVMDGSLPTARRTRRGWITMITPEALKTFIRDQTERVFPSQMPPGPYRDYALACRRPDPSLTLRAAARMKGVHKHTLAGAIRAGKIRAEKRPGGARSWFIDPQSLAEWSPCPIRQRTMRRTQAKLQKLRRAA